jgi:uncharacterized protein YceH (UPF0502 family)
LYNHRNEMQNLRNNKMNAKKEETTNHLYPLRTAGIPPAYNQKSSPSPVRKNHRCFDLLVRERYDTILPNSSMR